MNLIDFLSEDDNEEVENNNDNTDIEPTEITPDENLELNDEIETTDSNRMGVIRTVSDAHLVYKRERGDSTFAELWIYNTQSSLSDDLDIRQEILSGTDIENDSIRSEDGTQKYSLYSVGDVQMMQITGLPQ